MATSELSHRDGDTWFLIIGCQRSGTTLMRLVLDCHSRIQCIDEPVSYGVLSGRAKVPCAGHCLIGLKVPCLTEQLGDETLWDPIFLPEIPNTYARQPLVFMVRDVRDTIVSMKGLRVAGVPWFESCLTPTLEAKRRTGDFMERYGGDIAALDEARYPELARAALYWRYKVEALHDHDARGFPTDIVRYEDLVAAPRAVLTRVCTFLGVPWEEGLLDHASAAHRGVDGGGMAIGGTNARRPIDSRSTNRWCTAFSDDEVAEILRFAGPIQASLYP